MRNSKETLELHSEITKNEEDEEDDSVFNVEDYLKKVEEEIAIPNNWKVRNWASFGIYQAQNMPIYLDIEKLLASNFSEL